MINLKKIVAVALAATMCMGMSTVAFASGANDGMNTAGGFPTAENGESDLGAILASPGERNNLYQAPGATDGKGTYNPDVKTTMDLGEITEKSFDTNAEVADILKENGVKLPKNTEILPMTFFNITDISDTMNNVLTVAIPAADFSADPYADAKYHAGDEVLVMVETGPNTGVWEIRPYTLNSEGKFDMTVEHTGAVIVLKTMKNGRVVQQIKDGNGDDIVPPTIVEPGDDGNVTPVKPADPSGNKGTSNNAAASVGTSPKTGEF